MPSDFRAEHYMGMPAIRRHWTTGDVRALIDEARPWPRYELIDGELLVTPAPGGQHQMAAGELFFQLADYLRGEPVGVALMSPADLELSTGTITQPDVFVVAAGGAASDGPFAWNNVTTLLLAIEVISPGSVRTDRVTKREYFMEVGVPEYLIVDVDARMIEQWTPSRATPAVLKDQLVWNPAGTRAPMVLSLPAYFDRIAAQLQLLVRS